jgi:hypothetical protein
MSAPKKYPDELRERVVAMVMEVRAREGKGRGEIARHHPRDDSSATPATP